jgi:hypothetical protein
MGIALVARLVASLITCLIARLVARFTTRDYPLTPTLIPSVFQNQSNHLFCCPVSAETDEVRLAIFGLQTVNHRDAQFS